MRLLFHSSAIEWVTVNDLIVGSNPTGTVCHKHGKNANDNAFTKLSV